MKKENITSVDLKLEAVCWKKKDSEEQLVIKVPHERDYESIKAAGFVTDGKISVSLVKNGNLYEAKFRLGVCKDEERYFVVEDYTDETDYNLFNKMRIDALHYSTWWCTAVVNLDTDEVKTTIEPEYILGTDLDLAATIQLLFSLSVIATNANKKSG